MKQSFEKIQKTVATLVFLTSLTFYSYSQTSIFSLSFNSTTTNFNYGKSNAMLQPYKKNFKGLQAGVSYQAGISRAFSVVPEIYFSMKGAVLKKDNPLTSNKSTLRLYSIDAPVLARLHCNKLYLNAGPYLGYTAGGRVKTEGSEDLPERSEAISFGHSSADFKRWDLGMQAGAGYHFSMKKNMLTLDVRYGYGFVNMSRDLKRYNRTLNISLVISKPSKKAKA